MLIVVGKHSHMTGLDPTKFQPIAVARMKAKADAREDSGGGRLTPRDCSK